MTETRSVCAYCGVGCGVIIESDGDTITAVRGDPDHPANRGRLCSKGSTLHLSASADIRKHARLLTPQLRHGSDWQAITWSDALGSAADRFAEIIGRHGPDAVGFYVSGQLLTEDYYVFNKLAKGLIGTNNIDSNSRLCMSSAVAGYKRTLGSDAPPACYEDIDHTRCLFIAGSNTAWAHPVLFRRIEAARQAEPELRIVVVDPRRTETAAMADLHLAIEPGTDVLLFHGMLHLMIWEEWIDRSFIDAHTEGFAALRDRVREYSPAEVARRCGISLENLTTAARWFARSGATLSLYCQGLNQSTSGTAKNTALINLHLATGQIGRIGAGPFSLTGQPNAMGGREVGAMANLMSGHRDLANAEDRAELAALWGVAQLPASPGKTAVELFQAAADGEVRALWIACTNPAQSMPDQPTVRRALERVEFVVVQEAFSGTATAGYAHLLLPATSWGEKEGTVTNSERRISRVRAVLTAPGEARHDWRIATDFARALERRLCHRSPEPGVTLFPYESPEQIWQEHRLTTRGRDLDISGLDWATLERDGPQQWPYRPGDREGRARLYLDRQFATASGRARFDDSPYRPVAEPCDARFPIALTTGRLRDQWHGMSRSGLISRLFGHSPEPRIDVHPGDLQRRGIAEGDLVAVVSRRGMLVIPAHASREVAPAQAFLPMHWGQEWLGGRNGNGEPTHGVNTLLHGGYCPQSKQPELKHAAVRIQKAEFAWHLSAMAWLGDVPLSQRWSPLRQALEGLFDYLSCVPFGHERAGIALRAAAHEPPSAAQLEDIACLMGLAGPDTLDYRDRRRQHQRTLRLARQPDGTKRLDAFLLAGDTRGSHWLSTLLHNRENVAPLGSRLLMASAIPPEQVSSTPRAQVCTCLNVSADEITRALATIPGEPALRLSALQSALQCGTQCGSCLPRLKQLILETAS